MIPTVLFHTMPHLRYLEFYSGVGGWTMSLQNAVARFNEATVVGQTTNGETKHENGWTTECVAALDHSDLCTAVYQHNFVSTSTTGSCIPIHPILIENLTISDLIRFDADIWMMSPPCQPHTRQHGNQSNDINDTRSNSFLHLCRLLSDMETSNEARLPSIVLLENVIGFESSNSCRVWTQALLTCHYRVAQFHLQPTQVGVPNDRPRYYCVAVRNHDNTTGSTGNSGTSSCPITSDGGVVPLPVEADVTSTGNWMSKYFSNPRCTENSHFMIHSSLIELGVIPGDKVQPDDLPALSVYLDSTINESNHKDLCVSETLLTRPAAWCLDIVTPSSHRSSCFTSAYGKYAKGTGSVLLQTKKTDDTHHLSSNFCGGDKYKLIPPEERQYDPNWASTLTEDGCYLRYFSGNELTRLFGFQDSFTFPTHTTMRQQWKLIGNSLNVTLTTTVVELALRTYFNKPQRKSSR